MTASERLNSGYMKKKKNRIDSCIKNMFGIQVANENYFTESIQNWTNKFQWAW